MTDVGEEAAGKGNLRVIKGGRRPTRIIEAYSIGEHKKDHPSLSPRQGPDLTKVVEFRRGKV